MFPDVHSDDRDVREQRILVRGGDDLEKISRRVQALQHNDPSKQERSAVEDDGGWR